MPAFDPIAASVISAVGFGFADFMGGRAALRLGAPLTVALVQAVAAACMVVVVLLGGYGLPSGQGLVFSLIAGLADGIALILLYRGLAVGRIGVVAPLTGVCSIAVPALAELLFVTSFGPQIIAGIVLSALAVVLIAHGSSDDDPAKPVGASVALGLASGATFGITTLFLGLLEPAEGNGGALVMRVGAIATVIGVVFLHWRPVALDRRGLAIGTGGGLLDAVGSIGLVYAATTYLIGVASAINALYAGVTVLLGVFILGERLGRGQIAGLALGAVAILLLAQAH
jgi:drug/metabolite transporter (DMT)-like permease